MHLQHHLIRPRPFICTYTNFSSSGRAAAEGEAETKAQEKETEELEEGAPFTLSHGNLPLSAFSVHAHKKGKVSNVQRAAHLHYVPRKDDERFMREALHEAQKAAFIGEVPVGAVLVSQGRIIARAHNRVEREKDPTAHAEMMCIRSTAKHLGGWRLLNSTLYVTLEPCPMCAGALLQARVGAVVWGAQNPLLGADGSWVSLFPPQLSNDNMEEQPLNCEDGGIAQERGLIHPFNPDIRVRSGILASDCSEIMKAFFRKRRKETKEATRDYSSLSRLFFVIQKAFHIVLSMFKVVGLHRVFQSNKFTKV